MSLVEELISSRIIDNEKPKFITVPHTLNGELLMRIHYHPVSGRQMGVESMTISNFETMFGEALRKFKNKEGKLSELLIEAAGDDPANKLSFKTWIEDGDIT